MFKSNDNDDVHMYCAYSVISDVFNLSDTAIVDSNYVHPATKEQRDTLTKAMADAGYTFDFEKKELKKIEQKPTDNQFTPEQASILDKHIDEFLEQKHTWNEEDEEVFHCLEYTVKHYYDDKDTINKCCSWLKSIKERIKEK